MKAAQNVYLTLAVTGLFSCFVTGSFAQSEDEAIAITRSVIKSEREAVVRQNLQLTDSESKAFWPVYRKYRAEMEKVGDDLLSLVKQYAAHYPDVPENQAGQMLDKWNKLQSKKVDTRTKFLKESGKVLPAAKNMRLAQVENRFDLALQLQLAKEIPLTPIEGRIQGSLGGAVAVEPGVPGGTAVQVFQLNATVTEIHKASRKVTLMAANGIKQTVKVDPEAINFDQIHIGDHLDVEVTQELVVQMAKPGETVSDGTAGVVALSPKGAKPGGVIAETTQVTATISSIDKQNRTASLRFEDGSTKTFAVRPDVDLSKRNEGDKVVFSLTEMVALRVHKQ